MRYLLIILFFTLNASLQGQNDLLSRGEASFYAKKFEGRKTASGQKFSNRKMTAAHKSLPFGTKVKVTNLKNDKSVVVTINDRLPRKSRRTIDLSQSAASELGFIRAGITKVSLEIIPE
ncbi:MAG TPA: septal ring lytic transglycosylase RlpA family protein [Bacteroidia bacterium]|jgi:rare lipoprotein A